MTPRLLVTATVAALSLLVVPRSSADDASPNADEPAMTPEAKMQRDLAISQFALKDYESAAASFRRCYELDPQRACLFGWAQSERLRGNCAEAVVLYQRYHDVAESASQREAAEDQVARCARVLAEHHPAPAASPVAAAKPRVEAPSAQPWYRDPAGGILVVSGIAAAGVGTALLVISSGDLDDARASTTYAAYARHAHAFTIKWDVGLGGVTVGSALVVAGVLRYVLRSGPTQPYVSTSTGGGATSLIVGGWF